MGTVLYCRILFLFVLVLRFLLLVIIIIGGEKGGENHDTTHFFVHLRYYIYLTSSIVCLLSLS